MAIAARETAIQTILVGHPEVLFQQRIHGTLHDQCRCTRNSLPGSSRRLREWLERGGIAGLTDQEMQAQLAGIRYRHSPAGRVEIESKEDAKKRGQSSPDRAEALVLAYVQVVPREQTVTFGGSYTISPI